MTYAFDADTAVTASGTGTYTTTITDRWGALGGQPNGGYLLAVCMRALHDELPLPDPLVASGFYLRPAAPGPATIHTEVARRGRRVATGEARLIQGDREIVRVVASFADLTAASGRTLVHNKPPALPPPEEAVDPLGGRAIPGVSITERVAYRAAEPPGWVRGAPTGEPSAEFWMRWRDGRPTDVLSLLAFVDAAAPVVLEIGEAGSATIELTVHVRARPAPGWVACRAVTRHVVGGYHEEDFEIWDADGRLVAQSRQLALLT